MSKVQTVRALVEQRLTAAAEEIFGLFERTIAEYEEELCRSKEENERQQKLLDAVFNPQLRLHRADVQQLLEVKEEVPSEQQERSSSLDQEDPEPPHIKEEQEELWSSQEGEQQLQGLEEADITKSTFTPVPVKSEDDEEKPQSSQLHHTQTEHMETEAAGEDCGGPGPHRDSDPHLPPDPGDNTGTAPRPETDDSADCKETREPQSGLNFVNNDELPLSFLRRSLSGKRFSCSECGKRFSSKGCLKLHMRIHTGERPYGCSVCGKSFKQNGQLTQHKLTHREREKFSCGVCSRMFKWPHLLRKHKCAGVQSSQLQESQTAENREAESAASSSSEEMDSEAAGGDCGRPEPDRNSDPDLHLQTDPDNRTGEPQSGLNSLKHEELAVCDFICTADRNLCICSECGKRFHNKTNLRVHMIIHTQKKPFSCTACSKRFSQKPKLIRHMRRHSAKRNSQLSVSEKLQS